MTLVFATQNKNKLREVQKLLPESIELLSLADIGCYEELEETQGTIEGNATQKADYIKRTYGYDCFADDTGLLVDFLNGAPGVYSARYAGSEGDSSKNMGKLLRELESTDKRDARFKTVIALRIGDNLQHFEGICEGEILHEGRGDKGFGYDPIFLPKGYDKSFAEMDLEFKNSIGHRGRAVSKLVKYLSEKAVNI